MELFGLYRGTLYLKLNKGEKLGDVLGNIPKNIYYNSFQCCESQEEANKQIDRHKYLAYGGK